MKLAAYRSTPLDEARLGVVQGDSLIDVAVLGHRSGVDLPSTMLELIDLGPDAVAALGELIADGVTDSSQASDVRWPTSEALAPIPLPQRLCRASASTLRRARCRESKRSSTPPRRCQTSR
ncbi:MAG: hypothetical protein R2706_13965 [Acidimicrobiales bacterium]